MKLFKWQRGRQSNCRYWKYTLWFFKIWRFGFDGYILAYPKLANLPEHTDKIDGRMWRLNITLKGYSVLWVHDKGQYWRTSRYISLFRPDLHKHMLFAFTRTYKLSLGFAIFNK